MSAKDIATSGSGVSNQTLAIGYSFNDAGFSFQQTSYSNNSMTTVENQDQGVYKGYGRLIQESQETSSAVNTSAPAFKCKRGHYLV